MKSFGEEINTGGVFKFSDGLNRIVAEAQGPNIPVAQIDFDALPPGSDDGIIAPQPQPAPLSKEAFEKLFGFESKFELPKYIPLMTLEARIEGLAKETYSPEEVALIRIGAKMALYSLIDFAEVQAANAALSETPDA